jgi:hypothetical protein
MGDKPDDHDGRAKRLREISGSCPGLFVSPLDGCKVCIDPVAWAGGRGSARGGSGSERGEERGACDRAIGTKNISRTKFFLSSLSSTHRDFTGAAAGRRAEQVTARAGAATKETARDEVAERESIAFLFSFLVFLRS